MKKSVTLFYAFIFIVCAVLASGAVQPLSDTQLLYANISYRTMERNGLYYIPAEAGYATGVFGVNNKNTVILTSHDALVSLCKLFSFNKDGVELFDVRILACFYCALLFSGVLLVFYGVFSKKRGWTNFLFLCLSVAAFFDYAYLQYFSSFFVQPFIMLLLLNIFGLWYCMFRHQSLKLMFYIPYLLFMLVLLFSFEPVALISVLFLSLFGFSMWGYCGSVQKKWLLTVSLTAIFISSLTLCFNNKCYDYEERLYSSVFQGVMLSGGSAADLALDSSLNQLKGTFYSSKNVDDYNLQEEFYSKIGYWEVISFYLKNPRHLLSMLNFSANNAFSISLPEHGEADSIYSESPLRTELYSFAKSKFFPNTLYSVSLFALIYVYAVVLICNYNIRRGGRRGIVGILICKFILYISALVCTPLFTGVYLIGFNNFIFYFIFDVVFITSIIGEIRFMLDRREHIKNDYGV